MGNQANKHAVKEEEEKDRDWNFHVEFGLGVKFVSKPGVIKNVDDIPKSQKYIGDRTKEEFNQFIDEKGHLVDSRVGHLVLMSSLSCLRVLLVYLWAAVITLLLVGHLLNDATTYTIGYLCLFLYVADLVLIVIRLQPKMISNYNEFVKECDNDIESICNKYKAKLGNGFNVIYTKKYVSGNGDCIGAAFEDPDGFFFLGLPFLMAWPAGLAALLCNNCAMKCKPSRTVTYVIHIDYHVQQHQQQQQLQYQQPQQQLILQPIMAQQQLQQQQQQHVIPLQVNGGGQANGQANGQSNVIMNPQIQLIPLSNINNGNVNNNGQQMIQMTQEQYQQMMSMMANMQQQQQQLGVAPQGVGEGEQAQSQPYSYQTPQGETYQ